MPRDLEVVWKMSLADFFRSAPDDPCPDTHCVGRIARVDSTWTQDHFMVDAICGVCKERWALIEEFDFQVQTEPGISVQGRMCAESTQERTDDQQDD